METMLEETFAYLGEFLANALFFVWCRSSVDDDRPEIIIPDNCLVSKFSLPVLYYVAGWTLQRASLALTVPINERDKFVDFAKHNKISCLDAKLADLPYTLVELRQHKSLFFGSKDYFEWIKMVESTYIHNLTLNMMIAFADGDLVEVIDSKIKTSEKIRAKFFLLFDSSNTDDDDDGDEEKEQHRLAIMYFILDRYVWMRGCWFVKYMKGNQGKSLGERLMDSAPTSTKVAHAAIKSKAVADALSQKERDLWLHAEESVTCYEDEEDKIADVDENINEYYYEESDTD